MHVGIIGSGYVGLVTGACFSEFGVFVTCVDRDEGKIRALNDGSIPFYEPGLKELVGRNLQQGRLRFSTDIKDAVDSSLVVFIAVGTPPRGDGSADMSYIESVAEEIARNLDGYKVIVTKSTVPVGTGRKLKELIRSKLPGDVNFDIASNPEFLREGSAIEDFMRPDRVIIGAESPQAAAILKDLYRPLYLIETPFVNTEMETAELIKYASNSFLATKISFMNEMANLCDSVGADVHLVARAMGLDKRIGPKFLHPGPGYGGSCFPKDTRALLHLARGSDVELGIVEATIRANDRQRELMSGKIARELGDLGGKRIGVLGLSFKPNTNDIREAPSIHIIERLLEGGARVQAYDPVAVEDMRAVFPQVDYRSDAYQAADGADALVIVTEWNQFRNLDLKRIKDLMKGTVLFDLRNVYEPEKAVALGFSYHSVGRDCRR